MKIVTSFLESVAGIEIYPLISFMIFFVFFISVTVYVLRLDKNFITSVSNYPINEDETDNNPENNTAS